MKKIILFILIGLFMAHFIEAQQCIVEKIAESKGHDTTPDCAFVDFISTAKLRIRENAGTKINDLGAVDGKNHYRAECYVPDGDKQVFFISAEGGTETKLTVYLEPKDYHQYEVNVSKIASIEWEQDKRIVVPKENTAGVYISCKSDQLIIKCETGTVALTPELKNDWYVYETLFDLSSQEQKDTEHVISLSVGGNVFLPYTIGQLGVKEGRSFIVLIMESCYEQNINHANESFRKGIYTESYSAYQKAFECGDKPAETTTDETKMKNMLVLAKASEQARKLFDDAEKMKAQSQWKECLELYQEAYKIRLGILKMNPTDEYCLQYQKIYEDLKQNLPRRISGKVVNNIRMDVNGNNFPIPDLYIIAKVYKKLKNDGSFDDEVKDGNISLGQTDAKGEFQIFLPKDAPGLYHSIVFCEDKYFKGKKNQVEYKPTTADIQDGLIIRITPQNINRQ